jgi:3'(2'), 5'-bisphosphate nucleotidase
MRQIDLESHCAEARSLAHRAGRAILDIYNAGSFKGEHPALLTAKSDGSPLTLADIAAHRVIFEGLRQFCPDIPVVSEEDAASQVHRRPDQMFWLIDPLDGTKEFLARNGEFTVNIALVNKGEVVWGVVYAPVLDQTYWGGKRVGAWRQTASEITPIQVAAPTNAPDIRRVIASKSHLNAETTSFIQRLGHADIIQAGSSLKFCRVAEGAADIYPRLAPTCEWDTAAAQAVVEGAGGYVYDSSGAPLRYGKPEVLNPHFIAAAVPFAKLFE